VIDAVRAYKFLIMGDFLSDWDQADLKLFVPLLRRFARWMDGIEGTTQRHGAELARLAEGIAEHNAQDETI